MELMERTHIMEIIRLHHEASVNFKSTKKEERRHSKEHITSVIGGRHEKNE